MKEINLVCTAGIPNERYLVGLKAMDAGKDFFSDIAAFTTQKQCDEARKKVKETGLKWFVYYKQRFSDEAATYAGRLIKEGRIGHILSVKGWGIYKIGNRNEHRADWFYKKEQYGGIIPDLGSHQLEEALYYAGAKDAKYISSRVGNLANPEHPGFEDYGDAFFITDNGIPCYISVDWYTPKGLSTFGDGRMFICGTKGYIEIRKNCDVAATSEGDHVIIVDEICENHYRVHGRIGYPFFSQLIEDCINRTEIAVSQEHTFRAMELSIEAEEKAVRIK